MHDAFAIRSCVTLMRNYPDMPFDVSGDEAAAARVISRTAGALQGEGFTLHLLREMTEERYMTLLESEQIPAWVKPQRNASAVMLPMEGTASVTLGGTAHVAVASLRPGMNLEDAAEDCFRVDDMLSRQVSFAFDEELGYLQEHYIHMGTGLTASQRLHLPLLMRSPALPEIRKAAEAAGVHLLKPATGVKTDGGMVDVVNGSAMGRTEQEICQLVTAEAHKLCEMEAELQHKTLREAPLALEDKVWRALGTLQSARMLSQDELWSLWSDVRLGAALELLPVTVEQADGLIPEALTAHLCSYAEETLTGEDLSACRASRVRELLAENPLA